MPGTKGGTLKFHRFYFFLSLAICMVSDYSHSLHNQISALVGSFWFLLAAIYCKVGEEF